MKMWRCSNSTWAHGLPSTLFSLPHLGLKESQPQKNYRATLWTSSLCFRRESQEKGESQLLLPSSMNCRCLAGDAGGQRSKAGEGGSATERLLAASGLLCEECHSPQTNRPAGTLSGNVSLSFGSTQMTKSQLSVLICNTLILSLKILSGSIRRRNYPGPWII